jgi:hypothetical protein
LKLRLTKRFMYAPNIPPQARLHSVAQWVARQAVSASVAALGCLAQSWRQLSIATELEGSRPHPPMHVYSWEQTASFEQAALSSQQFSSEHPWHSGMPVVGRLPHIGASGPASKEMAARSRCSIPTIWRHPEAVPTKRRRSEKISVSATCRTARSLDHNLPECHA